MTETVHGYVSHKYNNYRSYSCTDSPKRLYEDEEALLCETREEAIEELKNRHPDIDEGYGYVNDLYVYDRPGLTTTDKTIAKKALLKHGPMQCHVSDYNFKGKEGFVISDGIIRYDEKTAKSRAKSKQESPSRLTVTELHNFLVDLAGIVPDDDSRALRAFKRRAYKFDSYYSGIHQRALIFTEIVLGCGDLKNRPEYEKMKTRWNNYTKWGDFDDDSRLAIKKLRAFFADPLSQEEK